MFTTTNSLVAKSKRLALPIGAAASLILGFAFLSGHNTAHAAAAPAPMDDSSVSSLVALDNAVEAVAARVTPAVVNVAVTSRVSSDDASENSNGNGGGNSPQDLPPGLRQFFFGQGGQGMKPQPQFEHGIGSGIIISPDGYILTNDHVVDGATQMRVTLDDRRVFTARLIGADKLNDLAVIKIDAHNLPSIPWGDSSNLHPGQTVLAFGNPFGNFPFTVTRGIVSALNRPNPYSNDPRKPGDFIQTDAAINPGNSGGPLVDAHGELIGIDSFISMNDVTPDNAGFFSLPDATGAIVSQVTPDSPAGHAGLKAGDVLRELNGKRIANGSALQVAVSEMAPGNSIELGVLRDGKSETIRVTVGEYHANKTEEADNAGSSGAQGGKLGLAVADLTSDVRQQLNVPEQVHGAAIQTVRPGSAAEDAGLAPGNVILEVNRHSVENAESFVNAVHSVPAGKDILLLVWANGGASYRVVHPDQNLG